MSRLSACAATQRSPPTATRRAGSVGRRRTTRPLTLRWENEGWTITGEVGRERCSTWCASSASWQVRQFLLFRDLDEPDLWLGTDGRGRWGEMNGAHRLELDGLLRHRPGVHAVHQLRCRSAGSRLEVGEAMTVTVVTVDVETLDVVARRARLLPLVVAPLAHVDESGLAVEFDVDEFGLVIDFPGRFRRQLTGADVADHASDAARRSVIATRRHAQDRAR